MKIDNDPIVKKRTYNWAAFDSKNKQHMQLLSLCRQAQWTVKHDRYGEVADLKRLSDWLKSEKSPVRKPLAEMTTKELSTVIVAFGGIVNSTFK